MAKNAFFPWPMLEEDTNDTNTSSFLPIKPFSGPDSKMKGKPSQTVLKNSASLAEMFSTLLTKKDFYLDTPAIYHQCKVKMSFRALDEISTRLANNLSQIVKQTSQGKNPDGDSVVAFALEENDQTEKMIALIFAILKLGLTYMPLSPSSNSNDFTWALNIVRPVLLIVGSSFSSEMEETIENLKESRKHEITSFEELWNNVINDHVAYKGILEARDSEVWEQVSTLEKTVGIFFSAGSVSSPHGVRISSQEVFNRLHWQTRVFPAVPSDAFALTMPPTDARSLTQIMTPILSGKPLTIINQSDQLQPEQLASRIAEVKLSRLTLNPPAFENLLDLAAQNSGVIEKLASVTHWTISGGPLKVDVGRKFFKIFSGVYKSGVFLIAMYGMTETLGEATYEIFFNSEDFEKKVSPIMGLVSVGVPILNTSVAIIDRFEKTLPLGGRGEVVISGVCLAGGGYVGQSAGFSKRGEAVKEHIFIRTGDIGRILQDNQGIRRLYIEGRFDDESVQTGGETINLQQWWGEVMHTKLCTDCAIITYHRGRDSQVIVAAVVLKGDATCIQVLEKIHARKGYANNILLPTVFAVDKIPKMDTGRVDKKQIRQLFRKILLECDDEEWKSLDMIPEEVPIVKFVCKAIALSTGLPLVLIIRKYGKNYFDIGGTPLNSVMTVKMCRDNGFPIKMKEFIEAKTVGDIVEILRKSKELLEPNAFRTTSFDGKFAFEFMSPEDEDAVVMFLKNDCPQHNLINTQGVIKYWRGFVNSIRDQGLCLVVKLGTKIVGVALNGDVARKPSAPKPPKDISYGLELLEASLETSKFQMWRKSDGNVAQCYFVGITCAAAPISVGEKVVLLEELLSRSCLAARSAHFASVVLSTANPVVQEVAIHLLQYQPVLEFPVARFKSKNGSRPFSYADDNHAVSVLIKNVGSSSGSSDATLISKMPSAMQSAMSAITGSIDSSKASGSYSTIVSGSQT